MRGKVYIIVHTVAIVGITPAYAGKRYSFEFAARSKRDHPRLCGEKFLPRMIIFRQKGSPPPMRGKAVSRCSIDFS